jgi:thiol-disulfide isomerase/thioredoxin
MTRRSWSALALAAWLGGTATLAGASEPSRFLAWTDPAPTPVRLNELDGRPVSIMRDYAGKVVLVSFWASWCEFCREQMLAMERLKQRLAGEAFDIVAVNFGESPRRVREYLKTMPVDLRVLLDPDQTAAKAWRVRVLPVNYLVGADGEPRYTVLGEFDWASDEAVGAIRRLLSEAASSRRAGGPPASSPSAR